MAWASIAETLTYTGKTVTDAELEIAQGIVEIYAGTTEEASDAGRISSTNLRHLKKAVAYQTAWMQENPSVFSAMNIDTMAEGSSGGMRIVLADDSAIYLAPLALLAIKRLSWKAIRSIRVRRMNRHARALIDCRTPDGFEECGPGEWQPL